MAGRGQMSATERTSLSPATFYDLLADPQFYKRWSEIRGIKTDTIDAPPGIATTGTRMVMRGTFNRRIPYTCEVIVTNAQRPRLFETQSQVTISSTRSLVRQITSQDRYDLAPDGGGTTVTLTSTFERSAWMEFPPISWFLWLHLHLLGRRAYSGALREMLRSAERYVAGPQTP